MSGFTNAKANSYISEVSSLKSISTSSTNSAISSMNDGLLAQEISIFEAIATSVTELFEKMINGLAKYARENPDEAQDTKKTRGHVFNVGKTSIENEFETLKDKVQTLNKIIHGYNDLSTLHTQDVNQIELMIANINKMIGDREGLINSFGKFIFIAKDSIMLQRSILKNKLQNIEQLVENVEPIFPGANFDLMRQELIEDATQKKLAKFIRAMGLLDNMKHRLTLKHMIAKRDPTTLNQTSPITQLVSVAIEIDSAIKRFVDEPALSQEEDLTSPQALDALKDIREQAQIVVAQLTNSNSIASSSSSSSSIAPLNEKKSSQPDSQFSDVSEMPPEETNDADMEATFTELKDLLTELKDRIGVLHAEKLTEETTEETTEANKIITEIQKENETIEFTHSTPRGGKSHRQIRRTKWSTPRRRRNSRVKSLKPKRHVNKRKTKSAHKKRATKKH